jgi:hypothetical protein
MKDIKGLQVGNLVTIQSQEKIWLNNKPLVISEIFADTVSLKFNIADSISATEWIEFVQPLSITPETLMLFNGFKLDFMGRLSQVFGDYAAVFHHEKMLIFYLGYVAAKPVFIHELQNAVSLLTNGKCFLQLKQQEQ